MPPIEETVPEDEVIEVPRKPKITGFATIFGWKFQSKRLDFLVQGGRVEEGKL